MTLMMIPRAIIMTYDGDEENDTGCNNSGDKHDEERENDRNDSGDDDDTDRYASSETKSGSDFSQQQAVHFAIVAIMLLLF